MQEMHSEAYQHYTTQQPSTEAEAQWRWQEHSEEVYLSHFAKEEEELGAEEPKDVWLMDRQRRSVIRVHREARLRHFKPHDRDCPVKLKDLTSRRTTVKVCEDVKRSKVHGNWRQADNVKDDGEIGPPR